MACKILAGGQKQTKDDKAKPTDKSEKQGAAGMISQAEESLAWQAKTERVNKMQGRCVQVGRGW